MLSSHTHPHTNEKRLDIVVVELLANHPIPVCLTLIRWTLPVNFVAVCNMHNGKFRRRLPRSMHDETAFPAKAEFLFSYGIRIDGNKHACHVLVESTQTQTLITRW